MLGHTYWSIFKLELNNFFALVPGMAEMKLHARRQMADLTVPGKHVKNIASSYLVIEYW